MSGIYYDLASILSNAGCKVGVNSINSGWERRSRSSGGFPSAPLGVWWHHTASKTSVESDLQWQCHSCPDKPVGNMLLDRNGTFWPVAGGASNCAGKGGPWTFSRGTVPLDSGNTRGFQIECANNGLGEPYPQAQIDAYFRGSNALNAFVGNQPSDIVSHRRWAPTRKIDPATNSAVQGPWVPRSETSSGTWNLDDMKAECGRRAGSTPPTPTPQPPTPDDEDDMLFDGFWERDNDHGTVFAIYRDGTKKYVGSYDYDLPAWQNLYRLYGANDTQLSVRVQPDPMLFGAFGIVVGPRGPADGRNRDEWGNLTG
jgi:N-acetylmuramoyl-L-alanine amidase